MKHIRYVSELIKHVEFMWNLGSLPIMRYHAEAHIVTYYQHSEDKNNLKVSCLTYILNPFPTKGV